MNRLFSRLPQLEGLVRRPPLLYAAAREFIDRFERLDLEGREAMQRKMLDRLTRRAAQTPHYAAMRLNGFASAAVLDKMDVRGDPSAFETPNRQPRSRGATSGTSGVPMRVSRSLDSVVFEQAAIDWLVARVGHDFSRERVAVLRAADIKPLADTQPPFWRLDAGGRVLTLSTNHLAPQTVRVFVDAIRRFAPTILYAYPSAAGQLARLGADVSASLRIPLVVTSSEVLTQEERALIESSFECRVADYYGQAERAAFAWSTDGVYRFLGSYGVVELLENEVESWESYEVVGTNLHNTSQILLRYRTGDSVELLRATDDRRSVQVGLQPFARIRGRLDDVLWGADGRRYVGINHIPRTLERYGRFQFVQSRPDHVLVLVAGADPSVLGRPEPIIDRARLKLPPEFEIDVEFTQELVRTSAGKTPFVVALKPQSSVVS